MTLKIPAMVYADISEEAFVAQCKKLQPKSPPKFALDQIVTTLRGIHDTRVPALVAGFECRQGEYWIYHLIRPRTHDGILERTCVRESELEPHSPRKGKS
jgi:hypothetical protein